MSKHFFESFTNQFQLSKTLRFELIPQGKTLENIESKGLLVQDQNRANSYQEMKKTIDEYHKWFIELALKNVQLEHLSEYARLYYTPKDNRDDAAFTKVKSDLRKEIVKKFGEGEAKEKFKNLFAKELIKEDLETWIKQNKPDLFFDEEFKNFTTYFLGFHENRKNMYSAEEQGTAIAYRIVHENLPKFLDNVKLYEHLAKIEDLDFSPILTQMEDLIQGYTLDEIFSVQYFSNALSQNGIDFINHIIGGRSEEGKTKVKGLNEYINLYNQQQTDKKKKEPKFKQLYKQILSDRESISFLPEAFKDDIQLFDSVNDYYKSCLLDFEKDGKVANVLTSVQNLLEQIPTFDLDKIYLRNDTGLTNISQKHFGDYGVLKAAMSHYYEAKIDPDFQIKLNKKGISEKSADSLLKQKANWKKDYISIALLQTCLNEYVAYLNHQGLKDLDGLELTIADYFKMHFSFEIKKDEKTKSYNFVSYIQEQYKGIEGLLNIDKADKHNLKQDTERIHQLKMFLDSILSLLHFVKPLYCKDESISEKDGNFYNEFETLYIELDKLTPLYNMVRNYVTQKPYETTKVKLNFENGGNFLNGWVDSKTENSDNGTQYGGYLFRKKNQINEYDYFIGVSSDTKILRKASNADEVSDFERLEYYQLKTATVYENSYPENESYQNDKKALVASILNFVDSLELDLKTKILIDIEKLKNKETGELTPSGLFNKLKAKYPIAFTELLNDESFKIADSKTTLNLKTTILGLNRIPQAQEFKNHNFNHFTEAITAIDELSKNKIFNYFKISEAELNDVLNRTNKPLFLFKISNKDLSFAEKSSQGLRKSRGSENIHTLYFKALMEGNQGVFDIGTGEIFFRESSIAPKTTHLKNQPIASKNPLKPNQNTFAYDLIKDKRYTVDKFQFHLSTILNYTKPKVPNRFNEEVNRFLQNNPDVNIIGLDRGERHLIYLTLVNQKGEILKQESLNTIRNEKHEIETPYQTLLDTKEKQRAEARVEWGAIESIKELKEGYISQVVHKIATMMIENNAIVVMEDLNFGFKRGRFHVEKQVYQKLEKMLIDKLNYLVFKDKDINKEGGLMNALQLSNKFTSFKEMGKQSGFMYYVPAWNTSKIDPATGFVDFLKPRYESVTKSQEFISKFKSISFNKEKERFEFVFDYTDFTNRAEGSQTKWTVCADNQTRYFFNKQLNQNKGGQEPIKVCEALEVLFAEAGITYGNGANIKDQIVAQTSTDFFKKLLKYLATTLSLRHNNGLKGVEEQDFILSPVASSTHQGFETHDEFFFDSRKATDKQPKDADANGAYHIALKGLWVLHQLGKANDLNKPNLAISNKDWLAFAQNKAF
jgi:CRISPR-associated protein Cpf1